MKLSLLIIIGTMLTGSGIAYFLYSPSHKYQSVVSLNIDKTDSLLVEEQRISNYFGSVIEKDKWGGYEFTVNTITDFDFNPNYTLVVPRKIMLLSNPIQRDSIISKAKSSLGLYIDSVIGLPSRRKKSSIYGPMIRELNRLSVLNTAEKKAIFYTNFEQNTPLFSSYKKSDLDKLKKTPDEIKMVFSQMGVPGNYKGIKVYFIFRPVNDRENKIFLLMSTFFKTILEEAGATVYVGASLPLYDN